MSGPLCQLGDDCNTEYKNPISNDIVHSKNKDTDEDKGKGNGKDQDEDMHKDQG